MTVAKQGALGRRLLRNSAILAGASLIAALLSMLATALNVRALSGHAFGSFVLILSGTMLLGGLLSFSTSQPIIKLGAHALEKGNRRHFEELIGLGLTIDAASSLVAASIGCGVVMLLPDLAGLDKSYSAAATIAAASLLFQGYKTAEGVLRIFDRFDLLAASQVAASTVQVGVAAVLFLRDSPFVEYGLLAAVTMALPSLLQIVAMLILLRLRRYSISFAGWRNRERRRDFVAYCWKTSASATLDTIRINGDSAAVGVLVSVQAAGLYNVAKQLAGFVRKFTTVYGSVLFPELAGMAAKQDYAAAQALKRRAIRACALIFAVGVAGAAIFGHLVLRIIFGPGFVAAWPVLVLLTAAGCLQLASATYSMFVQAFVGPGQVMAAYLIATMVFVVAAALCMPLLGVVGAGLAQLLFTIALTVSCARRFAQHANVQKRKVKG